MCTTSPSSEQLHFPLQGRMESAARCAEEFEASCSSGCIGLRR